MKCRDKNNRADVYTLYLHYIYLFISFAHSLAYFFFLASAHQDWLVNLHTLSNGSRGAFLSLGVKLPRVTSIPRPPLPFTPLLS